MAVYIGNQAFSGPMESPEQLVDRAGLYAILNSSGRRQTVLCLDQSANVNSAVARRIGAGEFSAAEEPLQYAVLYTPGVQAAGRKRMLEDLRSRLKG
ncbi:MAG: hypothetical protein PVG91_10255 [Gammaproteobacteria bacterium]|jgi:hypothetical protein